MTTTAAPTETVDLTAASNGNGQTQPKRRGRPPGSKNKPKGAEQAAPKKRGRPRKTTTATATTRTRATKKVTTPAVSVPTQPTSLSSTFPVREAHTILIEDAGLTVVNSNGDSYAVTAPVIVDRRTKK